LRLPLTAGCNVTSFLVFLLAYTLSQFFRAFLAVIAPELGQELGLSAADLGNISAVWFAVFAIAQFPVGAALDRIGPRRTVPALMLAAVVGTLLFARATSRFDCFVAMGLIGLGCSPVYMGALYVFGRVYPVARFALLTSVLLGLGSAGNLLGATPLAWAAGTFGWRSTFLWISAATLVSAGLVLTLVRDPPRAERPDGKAQSLLGGLLEVVRNRALWPLIPVTATSYAIIAGERGLWIGPYLADVHGLDPVTRGNIVLIMAIAMSVGALVYGPLDAWLGKRKWLVVGGNVLSGLGFVALWLFPKPALVPLSVMIAAVGGIGMTYGVLMAHGRSYLPAHLLGRGITFLNFLFIGGAVVLQPASGAYVEALKSRGLPAVEIYANLHLAFGLTLLATTAIYLWSRESK
jgi:sugar phosphate permease